MTSRSRRDWALALAKVGLQIYPLPALSKEPIAGVSWADNMTTDAAQINAWFDDDPEMNYLVCPGEKFAVIDLDEKDGKDGVTNYTALNMEQIADDWCLETFIVKTPSGGQHLYIRVPFPVANSASKIGSGIDVRGARGYVVGPGCITDEVKLQGGKVKQYAGEYTVISEREFAEAPLWLTAEMVQHREKSATANTAIIDTDLPVNVTRAREFLSTHLPAVEGQGGDQHTFKTCAKLKDFGLSEDVALGLMLEPRGWNYRCEPPWTAGELMAKMRNAFSYGQNAIGNKADLWDAPGAFSEEEYMKGLAHEAEAERQGLEAHLFDPERILNSKDYREMVIPEYLPAAGFTAILAARGVGKTVTMMDLGCRIACDMMWHDMPIMEDFAVVYVCGEDDIGARDQFRAWCKHHERFPDRDRFLFMDTTFDLMNPTNVEMWVTFLLEKLNGRRAVIIVDTWQRATSGGSQNEDVDMQTAVHHAEAVAKSLRGPAVIAFHPPKADANVVLGSSIIENSSVAIWSVVKETGMYRRLTVSRIKGKGHDNFQVFEFKEIGLGIEDYFGREITGLIPERTGGTSSKGSAQEEMRTDMARMVYAEAIRDLIMQAEQDPEFAKHRKTAFSVKDTAFRLSVTSPTDNVGSKLDGQGEHSTNPGIVERRLRQLFESKRLYDFDDGGVLVLEGDVKTHFRIKPKASA